MKASYTNSRDASNPGHNDRTIDLDKAKHIDQSRTHLNKYVCVYDGKDFKEAELRFYEENFGEYLKQRNDAIIKNKHKKRVITAEDLWKGRYTKPEETIIQIGDIFDHPDDPKILLRVFNELQKYSNEITHMHCKILNAAVHMDESTPHIHVRKVWVYEDNGVKKIGQKKSLERAGIELPFPDRPESQYNNRKMTYDRMIREKMYELCKEHGLEVDIKPDPHNTMHLPKDEFILDRIKKDRRRAEREREERRRKRREEESRADRAEKK